MVKIKVNVKTKNDSIPSDTTKRKMPVITNPKIGSVGWATFFSMLEYKCKLGYKRLGTALVCYPTNNIYYSLGRAL